jgi:hypothetical protein
MLPAIAVPTWVQDVVAMAEVEAAAVPAMLAAAAGAVVAVAAINESKI